MSQHATTTGGPLRAYLNDPQLKAAFLAEITKHEQHDQFIKGDLYT